MLDKLAQIEARYEALTNELSSPELLSDPSAYGKAAKQHRGMGEVVERYRTWKSLNEELTGARELMAQTEDEEMRELARAIRVLRHYEADMVCAYRLDRTGEGPQRAVYSWGYNWLVQLAFNTRLRDINFAFKLCRRRVLDHIELVSEGSFIDAELSIRAQRLGFQIVQIGVDYFPRTRGVSTLSTPAVIGTMLKEMRELRRQLKSVRPVVDRR